MISHYTNVFSIIYFVSADILENLERIDTVIIHSDIPDFTAAKVKRFKFPTYVPPNVKDDMVCFISLLCIVILHHTLHHIKPHYITSYDSTSSSHCITFILNLITSHQMNSH